MRVKVTAQAIRAAFDAVKGDPSFQESRALAEQGKLPLEMIQAMSLRPELLRSFAGFGQSVYPGGLLERRLKELVIIEASRRNECQFCTATHEDVVTTMALVEDAQVALDEIGDLSERERVAIRYTRAAMEDSNRVPESLIEELRERFSDPEIVELTFLIGFINMLNMFNNCLQVRYHGEYGALNSAHAGRPGAVR